METEDDIKRLIKTNNEMIQTTMVCLADALKVKSWARALAEVHMLEAVIRDNQTREKILRGEENSKPLSLGEWQKENL